MDEIDKSKNWEDWNIVSQEFDRIDAISIESFGRFQEWFKAIDAIKAILSEVGSRLYVDFTCDTSSTFKSERYQKYVTNVVTPASARFDKLHKKYLASSHRKAMPYKHFDRIVSTDVELFCDENLPILAELSNLSQEYQNITGSMTADFEGKVCTLPELSSILEDPNQDRRKGAYMAVWKRRLVDKDKIKSIFEKMRVHRQKLASNKQFASYLDYGFKSYHRYDYGAADCEMFHNLVEKYIVPLVSQGRINRQKTLNLETLYPWDLEVDPNNAPPVKLDMDQIPTKASRIIHLVDKELGEMFDDIIKRGEVDLPSRGGKAPGGYQTFYSVVHRPFIFMNAVGTHDDLQTLFHEAGHAFHSLYASGVQPIIEYHDPPLEFAEVASMGMELFCLEHIDTIYDSETSKRIKRNHLRGIIDILPWIATIDAFQQFIYKNPGVSIRDIEAEWLILTDRFNPGLNWKGLEDIKSNLWLKQGHIFGSPLYYIEYGLAQLGALQLWLSYHADRTGTVNRYREALKLGGSDSAAKLYSAAGIKFGGDEDIFSKISAILQKEL